MASLLFVQLGTVSEDGWCATTQEESVSPMANLLVLAVSGRTEFAAFENQFIEELTLALEGFTISIVDVTDHNFIDLSTAQKIEKIKVFGQEKGLVATVWLENVGDETMLLNLVALSTSRSLVKIVEADLGPNAAAELALAAYELLGEAYLFSQGISSGPVEEVVRSVAKDVVPKVEGTEYDGRSFVALTPFFVMGGGVYGHEGESFRPGGGLALEIQVEIGWVFRPGLAFSSGPKKESGNVQYSGFGFRAFTDFAYRFSLGAISLGPVVGMGVDGEKLDVTVDTERHEYSWWSVFGSVGVDSRVKVNRFFAFVITGKGVLNGNNKELKRETDSSVLLTTTRLSWRVLLGFSMVF